MAKMLSVEIGLSTIKIAEMDYQAKKPKVYRCLELPTPEKAIKDGHINPAKMEILADTIKSALVENKIRTKKVLFTVFSGKVISREVVLPGVKLNQINAVIQANITEYFPVELDDYKVSHFLINTVKDGENAGKHKVLVIAVEKALLKGYDRLASELGLHLVDIDYTGNSLFQATKNSAGKDAIMVVKVEEENAIITIIKEGIMLLQRNVNYGIGKMAGEEVTAKEAIESLVNTMLRVIDFYIANGEENVISHIYVTGEGSKEESIVEYMAAVTQLPCSVLSNIRGIVEHKKLGDVDLNVYATVIGAGIKSIGFATEKEKERHETNYVSACVLIILFFIVMVAAIVSMSLIPYNMAVLEEKSLKKKQELYMPAKVVHDQYLGIQDLYQQVEYGHRLTEHSNDAILVFLAELEEKLPKDVELTEFASDDKECMMTMRVADKETAAGVINNLRAFDSLLNVTVETIAEEYDNEDTIYLGDEAPVIYFTVTCSYYERNITPPTVNEQAAVAETEQAVEAE